MNKHDQAIVDHIVDEGVITGCCLVSRDAAQEIIEIVREADKKEISGPRYGFWEWLRCTLFHRAHHRIVQHWTYDDDWQCLECGRTWG